MFFCSSSISVNKQYLLSYTFAIQRTSSEREVHPELVSRIIWTIKATMSLRDQKCRRYRCHMQCIYNSYTNSYNFEKEVDRSILLDCLAYKRK